MIASSTTTNQPHLSRARILAVDDDPFVIELLQEFLKAHYDLAVASNGEQVIACCRNALPDLVLLDVMLPGMDGYEVCRRLKSEPLTRDVPIIFVTAEDDTDAEIRALEAGAVDFICKPLERGIVLAHVRTHLLLKAQSDQLRNMAMTDVLTGVANRRNVESKLDTEWRRCLRSGEPISVIMIDIDEFKLYNDAYGHHVGDKCLQRIAAALASELRRAGDFVGRYGGEEFICVLADTSLEAAVCRANALGRAVELLAIEHASSATGAVVTISRGVCSTVPQDSTQLAALLKTADVMLYKAKRSGRNCTMAGALGQPAGGHAAG